MRLFCHQGERCESLSGTSNDESLAPDSFEWLTQKALPVRSYFALDFGFVTP